MAASSSQGPTRSPRSTKWRVSTRTSAPKCWFGRKVSDQAIARRPASARPSVSSSANSRSPPIGRPGRDARHGQSRDVAQHPHQIRRGRLALGVRIGRDDHLGDVHAVDPFANPVEQLADSQLLRPDTGQRIQSPAQHVVAAAEFARALDGLHVLRLLDDTHQRRVAARVRADPAAVLVGDVPAHRAEFHAVAHLGQAPR